MRVYFCVLYIYIRGIWYITSHWSYVSSLVILILFERKKIFIILNERNYLFVAWKWAHWKTLLRNGFIFSSWLFLCVFNLVKGCENMIIWCSNYSVFKKLVINSHCIKSEKLVNLSTWIFLQEVSRHERQRERDAQDRDNFLTFLLIFLITNIFYVKPNSWHQTN
jgi:hypothetical protein